MKRDSRFWQQILKYALEDTDSDGIPDYWEKEYGLDFKKNDANERTVDVNGKYTNIEMYINSLVHGIMEAGSKGGAVAD